jgi:Zn finger protein HypA/HybF involved in hydrogenase expression
MTCAELWHFMHADNFEQCTMAELSAIDRHFVKCPACQERAQKIIQESEANLTDKQVAACNAEAIEIYMGLAQARSYDPEL